VRHEGWGPLDLAGRLCFKYIAPLLGTIFAGNFKSYAYLPRSAEGFVRGEDLALMLKDAGLDIVNICELALGLVAIVIGEKRKN
jgi:ubiquinone/menaquinone biosynthesis C-methylase UbiE